MTDASLTGWGAHLDRMTVHGLWSGPLLHINLLEMKAVILTLQSFPPLVRGHAVAIMSDNTTMIAYINRQGGAVSRSPCKLAMELWEFCLSNEVFPSAAHVPGSENSLADLLSRQQSACHEWELNRTYL